MLDPVELVGRDGRSGPPSVETPQLLLRAPRKSDADDLFEIQADRDAMGHTYVAPDREATAAYLETYSARFAEDGFAPWVAVLRAERRVVGWGGLNRDPEQPHWGLEVAYFIHRSYWGRGLASELVQASLGLAFRDLGLLEVFAFTRPANHASSRVLTKAGFVFLRHVTELERDQYAATPSSWNAGVPYLTGIGTQRPSPSTIRPVEDQNVELIRAYYGAWNRGDLVEIERYLAGGLRVHVASHAFGRDGLVAFRAKLTQDFADLSASEEDVVAQRDKVVMRWRSRQRTLDSDSEIHGITIYRIDDGAIAEIWDIASAPTDVSP